MHFGLVRFYTFESTCDLVISRKWFISSKFSCSLTGKSKYCYSSHIPSGLLLDPHLHSCVCLIWSVDVFLPLTILVWYVATFSCFLSPLFQERSSSPTYFFSVFWLLWLRFGLLLEVNKHDSCFLGARQTMGRRLQGCLSPFIHYFLSVGYFPCFLFVPVARSCFCWLLLLFLLFFPVTWWLPSVTTALYFPHLARQCFWECLRSSSPERPPWLRE